MPLYYDPGYGYYGSGGYSSYTPYYITSSYSLYSSPSSSYNRSPVTSNYLHTAKRSNLASSRYKPKLSTISETPLSSTYHHSGLTSLTRIQSPKISPYRNSPKYVAPKPIPINTADIDVSATKYDRRRRSSDNNSERNSIKLRKTSKEEEERSSVKSQKSTSDESLNLENNENKNKSPLMPRVDGTDPGKIRSTIKRDRRVVRLSTVRFKPTSIKEKELKKPENAKHLELPTWRDQLGEDQTSMQNAKEKRKNSIEILLEPCIIPSDNNPEDIIQFSNNTGSQIVVEVDPLDPKGVRRLSLTNCPSFHEICEDISSDKIDDDLNAGELRRRASLIQEQEIEILNQLQKSGSGTFHYILERDESQDDCRKSVKRKSTKKGKKVRHKITATVNVENPPLTPILQEVQDDVINTNQAKMSYEVEEIKEEHTVHKIFKLPKKKQKVVKTGSKKGTGSKKEKEKIIENDQQEVKTETMVTESTLQSPKSLFSSKTLTGPEHFTFDIDTVSALDTKETVLLSPSNLKKEDKPKSPLKSLVPKTPILQNTALKSNTKTTDKIPSSVIENYPKELNVKSLQNAKQAQVSKNTDSNKPESPKVPKTPKVFSKTKVGSSDSGFGEPKSPATPKEVSDSVKPKSSTKLQKSESGEDFWSQIGARESLYMVNRRKQLLEQQLKQISAEQETDNEKFESHKKDFNRSESNDSVFSENKIISHDGIKKSSSDNSQLTTNKKTTEINSNKFSDLKQKSEEKQNNQIKQTNKLGKESKISMPAVSQSDCTVETTKTSQPKINSGLLAKIPESKNKQNSNDKLIPSLENKTDIKCSKETNRVEVEGGKSSENVIKKENEKTPVDAVKKQNATSSTAINILKNNSNCSASKESGRSDNQGAGAKLKSPPPTDDASVKTTTIKPTTTSAPTVISDNDKNQTKDDYDTKIRTIETGSSKADKTKIIGSLKNSTKRLNDQQTCSEKLLTNTLRENNEELHKTQSSQQQLPPTQTTKEQQEKLKKIIKPTATVADNQKPFETEKTEDITIRSGDNKKQPLFGTNNSDVGSKPTTQINQTTIESPPTTITTIKESELKDKGDQTTKFQQSPALSKFATVSDLNRCLLDVDADLSDFIPSEAENSDSSYEEDSNCEEIDENGMKKKNKNGKKKDKDEPAGFNPNKVVKLDHAKKCYVKDEKPPFPLIAKPRPLWKPEKHVYRKSDSDSESDESESDSECSSSDEYSGDELNSHNSNNNNNGITSLRSDIRMSTCSNDSGFEGGTAPSSPKKMLECDVNCHKKCEKLTANLCGVNQKLMVEALSSVKRGAHDARDSPSTPPSHNPAFKIEQNHDDVDDSETSYTFAQFQRSGHITAPATIIPRFKKYSVEDFHFLAVLGKGSFGKVLLAELRNTDYYYAVKCLKKDVVLQDDDVECTLIERKVLALGTKHPYLCHLFCTFQTESHLFFVMEYLNGGDLMFHIQQSGRFPEERARFYGAEIISGLKFLHKKGIIYRDLKLDNVLLDFDGHVRIADFGMCKLQVYLDRTADTFCGTPDYMAPEIIKGEKYNQNVDWWSFGVLLYEMLIGQSPFSGCDEDELFWSICNELPWFPVFLSKEATSILKGLLEKDATCRIGSQYSPAGDICGHQFFRQIDWHQLERRELVPPFKPQVKHPLDTQYFDKAFTRERVRLTPIDKEILQSMDQEQFQGFSYTNPNATLN